MNRHSRPGYRTDMRHYVMDLLDFAEEKFIEAVETPQCRAGALAEAAGAFPIIKARLDQEDHAASGAFALLGLFEREIDSLGHLQEADFAAAADQIGKKIQAALDYIQQREAVAEE
jgi:hypothetical protein